MTTITELEQEQDVSVWVEHGRPLVHIEHPERHGEAWCGAPVIGVRGRWGLVGCVVCIDLLKAARRRRT